MPPRRQQKHIQADVNITIDQADQDKGSSSSLSKGKSSAEQSKKRKASTASLETPNQQRTKHRRSHGGTRRLSSISGSLLLSPRSSLGGNGLAHLMQSPDSFTRSPALLSLEEEEVNDDEAEKRRNKQHRETSRRKSVFPSGFISAQVTSGSQGGPGVTATTKRLAPNELEDLFKSCIKLSSENKITVKNTWQLNLIDYIDEVIENTLSDAHNFQAASSTLDASVKIYSSRVDSVHSETYKVLSGLSRADSRRGDNAEDEDENEDDERAERPEKRSRRPRVGAQTLEQNDANINIKKLDFEYSIEPLHRSSTGLIDVNSYSSLLVNNLYISDTCELILDATKSRYDCHTSWKSLPIVQSEQLQQRSQQHQDVEGGEGEEESMEANEGTTSGNADNDSLTNQPPEQSAATDTVLIDTAFVPRIEEQEHQPEQNANSASENELLPLNDNGGFAFEMNMPGGGEFDDIPQSSDDFGNVNDTNQANGGDDDDDDDLFDYDFTQLVDDDGEEFETNVADEGTEQTNATTTGMHGIGNTTSNVHGHTVAGIDTVPVGIDVDNEYAYFDITKTANYNWSGMTSNWRFRSRLLNARDKDTSSNKKKKKSGKQAFSIDFNDIDELLENFDKKFEVPARLTSNMMSKKTIQNASSDKYLLPEDVHYDLTMLMKPFHIDSIKLIPNAAGGSAADQRTDFIVVYADNNPVQVTRKDDVQGENSNGQSNSNDDDDDNNVDYGEYGMPMMDDFGGADMPFDAMSSDDMANTAQPLETPVAEVHQESVDVDLNTLESDSQSQSPHSKDSYHGTLKLVNAPQQVEKLQVKYATRAKKVDVRALKKHLWSNLNTRSKESRTEDHTDMDDESSQTMDNADETMAPGAHFSDVVKSVRDTQVANQITSTPTPTSPPPVDFSDVSVPFCFICMLHLCNENNLELSGKEDLSDFNIRLPANA